MEQKMTVFFFSGLFQVRFAEAWGERGLSEDALRGAGKTQGMLGFRYREK